MEKREGGRGRASLKIFLRRGEGDKVLSDYLVKPKSYKKGGEN